MRTKTMQDTSESVQPLSTKNAQILFFIVLLAAATSFGIVFSSLTVYLIKTIGLSSSSADAHYATFSTWLFTSSIFGGFIGSRTSHFHAAVIGIVALILSMILMSVSSCIYWSLGLFCIGTALVVPNIAVMLGQLFEVRDSRRTRAFIYNYISMNLGVLLGSFVAGWLSHDGLPTGFAVANVCMLGALILLMSFSKRIPFISDSHCSNQRATGLTLMRKLGLLFISSFALLLLLRCLLVETLKSEVVIWGLTALVIVLLLFMVYGDKNYSRQQKRNVMMFLALLIPSIVFWVPYTFEQSILVDFYLKAVSPQIFGFHHVPVQVLGLMNSGFNLLTGLIIIYCSMKTRLNFSSRQKIAIGMMLMGAAYCILGIVSKVAALDGARMSLYWITFIFLLMAVAEMIIVPALNALPSELGPSNLQGYLFGFAQVWMGASAGVAALFSTGGHSDSQQTIASLNHYMFSFGLKFGAIALFSGLLMLLAKGFFRRFNGSSV